MEWAMVCNTAHDDVL